MTGTQRLLSDAELFYAAIISDGAFTADSEGDFYLKSSGEDIPYDELFAVLRNVEKAVLEKLLANIPTAWRIDHKSVCGNGITTEKVVAEDWLKSDPEIVTPLYANSIAAQARHPDWRFIQKSDQRIIDGQVMTCSDPEIGRWQGSEAFAIEAPKESPAQPYKDSITELHVGDSSFESWYSGYTKDRWDGIKQIARDAYAAGMGDPLMCAAQQPVSGDHIANVDISSSNGGREYIAEYFSKAIGRHDFSDYIQNTLAADFACVLANHLINQDAKKTMGQMNDIDAAVEVFQLAEQNCHERFAANGAIIEPGIAVREGLIAAAPFLLRGDGALINEGTKAPIGSNYITGVGNMVNQDGDKVDAERWRYFMSVLDNIGDEDDLDAPGFPEKLHVELQEGSAATIAAIDAARKEQSCE